MNFDLAEIRSQLQPGWSVVNIVLMVVLFWIFWPLGLVMVCYIVWGNQLDLDLSQPESFKGFFGRLKNGMNAGVRGFSGTGSSVKGSFEQWREQEQNRLAAERETLEKEKKDFYDLKKRSSAKSPDERASEKST